MSESRSYWRGDSHSSSNCSDLRQSAFIPRPGALLFGFNCVQGTIAAQVLHTLSVCSTWIHCSPPPCACSPGCRISNHSSRASCLSVLDVLAKSRSREPVKNTLCARAMKLTLIRFILLMDTMPEPHSRAEPTYVETSLRTDDWEQVYVTMLRALTALPAASDGSLEAFFPPSLHPDSRALGELDAFGHRGVDLPPGGTMATRPEGDSIEKRHDGDGMGHGSSSNSNGAALALGMQSFPTVVGAPVTDGGSMEARTLVNTADENARSVNLQPAVSSAERAPCTAAPQGEETMNEQSVASRTSTVPMTDALMLASHPTE
ncbi:MAG: hypothetical protein EOO65_03965 [Methanosarcinales archaeon]|nr:MAG: hypothetical protein EOO65_03965 [Methanosarcinales archaeon]